MIQLTEQQQQLITHVARGGLVQLKGQSRSDPIPPKSAKITIGEVTESFGIFFRDYSIYWTPEQERINELEEQLRIQGEELQKSLAKNKELKPTRKHRPTLTKPIVIDIEAALAAGVNTPEIESTYEVSATVISKIRRGVHPLSTIKVEESSSDDK